MTDHIVVLVTVAGVEEARTIARSLVTERLAACVNVVPGLVSFYVWKGEVSEDPEILLVMKTRRELFSALEARIRELHPYEVPEVIALPVEAGSAPYLAWLSESTREA